MLNRKYKKEIINKKYPVCYLCGKEINKIRDLSMDHVIPLSKGGKSTNENLKPTHKKCNQKKADMLLEIYLRKKLENER